MDTIEASNEKASFEQAVRNYKRASKLVRILLKYKSGIAELRRKHASFDIIRELLAADGVTVSARTVARFCHQVIEAEGEPRKRQYVRKSSPAGIAPNENQKHPEAGTNGNTDLLAEQREKTIGPWTPRRRGPRITDSKNL